MCCPVCEEGGKGGEVRGEGGREGQEVSQAGRARGKTMMILHLSSL